MNPQEPIDRLDQATADRLAKLAALPVDTSRLDAALKARIPRTAAGPVAVFFHLRAVAAALATIGLIGVIAYSLSGGAVLASPDAMAQVHQEMLSGSAPMTPVNSIAQANQAIAASGNVGVSIPDVSAEQVMCCCTHSIKDKQIACVMLKGSGDAPVTMAVAKAEDMRSPPDAKVRTVGGIEYRLQSKGNLNMVMTQRNGRWICLMGTLTDDQLIEMAQSIKL
jgi:hypothetical protein